MQIKTTLKTILGEFPFIAEMDWRYRRYGKPVGRMNLEQLRTTIPTWVEDALSVKTKAQNPKKIFVFSMIKNWLRYSTLLSLGLAGQGHQIDFGYLPDLHWIEPNNKYDATLIDKYLATVFADTQKLLHPFPINKIKPQGDLPEALDKEIIKISIQDYQYTLQVEDTPTTHPLYLYRLQQNRLVAKQVLSWLEDNRPDTAIIPNGMIFGFGAVYQVCKYLGIPALTFEFSDQHDRVWITLGKEIMFQDTSALWEAQKNTPFTDQQMDTILDLYAARKDAKFWNNFSRKWQEVPAEGAEKLREKLGYDQRPIFMLAANVLGDSLTLNRQTFSESMAEWIQKTVLFFAEKTEVQFVIRIHPGEKLVTGPSVSDTIAEVLPNLPEHVHVIQATDPVNTYDLMEIADAGMVYTTTAGLEMVLYGLPVVVAGNTHYRGKGFTLDPHDWDSYYDHLESLIANIEEFKPTKEQIRTAWHYAYCFFFNFPQPFPWHMRDLWQMQEEWPISRLLSDEGLEKYGKTLDYFAGEAIAWTADKTAINLER